VTKTKFQIQEELSITRDRLNDANHDIEQLEADLEDQTFTVVEQREEIKTLKAKLSETNELYEAVSRQKTILELDKMKLIDKLAEHEAEALKGEVVHENIGSFGDSYAWFTECMVGNLIHSDKNGDKYSVTIRQIKE
jgi:chromosome segregation ATPase